MKLDLKTALIDGLWEMRKRLEKTITHTTSKIVQDEPNTDQLDALLLDLDSCAAQLKQVVSTLASIHANEWTIARSGEIVFPEAIRLQALEESLTWALQHILIPTSPEAGPLAELKLAAARSLVAKPPIEDDDIAF